MPWTADLTGDENWELYTRLSRASRRYDRLTEFLSTVHESAPEQPAWARVADAWGEVIALMGDLNDVAGLS
jgi:hypothetical protein